MATGIKCHHDVAFYLTRQIDPLRPLKRGASAQPARSDDRKLVQSAFDERGRQILHAEIS